MKYLLLIWVNLAVITPRVLYAQDPDQSCCDETFPYWFCNSQSFRCSQHPAYEGAFKAPLPQCVDVAEFPDNAKWQPKAGAPDHDFPSEPGSTGSTYLEHCWDLGAHAQWASDRDRFLQGLPPTEPQDPGSPDDCEESYYLGQSDHQYPNDLAAYQRAQNDYAEQFNQAQASIEANNALRRWYLAACKGAPNGLPAGCCIKVIADKNFQNFGGDVRALKVGARTIGANSIKQCQDPCSIVIHVNVSPEFLYQTTDHKLAEPDEAYLFHSAAKRSFFTGGYPAPTVDGYDNFSFYSVILHEIGHWLGLPHSDVYHQCSPNDCYGTGMLMDDGGNIEPSLVNDLTPCDECFFRKLYCPSNCELLSVESDEGASKIQIYPNPTSRLLQLSVFTELQATLKVTIFNELGVESYSDSWIGMPSGTHTRTFDLSTLPSGNYVCRVTLGGAAKYINFAIQK